MQFHTMTLLYVLGNIAWLRTATLIFTLYYMKALNKPLILIPVSSKSVENVEVVGI